MYKIIENKEIANNVFQMILSGDTSKITKPGQFINIKLDNFYLRRPISISDYNSETITIIYKILGEGTKELATYKVNKELDILTGLGNGFTPKQEEVSLLVAGGVGVPPMYGLAKELIKLGNKVECVLGFNSKQDVFLVEELRNLGCIVYVATLDGTYGFKGNVINLIDELNINYNSYYACGPKGLLKALKTISDNGQLSLEERMGCGFGACMGCSCKTTFGYARICKEGPVLNASEVLFDE